MSANTPLVSILTPTYNRANSYLREAIDSALNQSYEYFELLVIDDGSTDNTEEFVTSFGDKRIRYLRQEHAGQTTALNYGLAEAQGELLAFLDSDDCFRAHKLRTQVQQLTHGASTGVVSGTWEQIDQGGRVLGRSSRPPAIDLSLESWLKHCHFITCSVLARTAVIRTAGGFDPTFAAYNDWDLWIRVAARGCEMRWTDDLVCSQRLHTGNTYYPAFPISPAVEKFFGQANGVPDELRQRGGWFLGRLALIRGVGLSANGQSDDAAAVFARAFELWPRWLTSDCSEAAEILAGTVKSNWLPSGMHPAAVQTCRDVTGRIHSLMPPSLRESKTFSTLLSRWLARGLVYDAHQSGSTSVLRAELPRLIQNDPAWLFTDGALAICLKAFLRV